MPVISFARKTFAPIDVEIGASLMFSLVAKDVPVASSCHGEGVCAKCKIKIVSGMENLSAESETEQFLKSKNNYSADSRVSCQTQVLGDVVVDASYW